jgi:hypothetical protein
LLLLFSSSSPSFSSFRFVDQEVRLQERSHHQEQVGRCGAYFFF